MIKKKILLSAYSCEPNKGSEPGVAWNWAYELKKLGASVLIVTRKKNEKSINNYVKNCKFLSKKDFFYFDLNNFFLFFENIIPGFIYLHYYLWQYFVYKKIKKLNIHKNFEIIHHITFGTFRLPSFLWKLNKKFIFGPVGSYEISPKKLKEKLNFKDRFFENLREFSNFFFLKFDPNVKNCLKHADITISKTKATKNKIKNFCKKIFVSKEIGINLLNKKSKYNKNLNFLFIGRYLPFKGGELLIDAFNLALKKNKNLKLSFYGNGNKKQKYLDKIKKLKLTSYIKINNSVEYDKIIKIYKSHDVLVFPSYHDSSGNAVLEALSNSLPVICLDTGGPGEIVNNKCGIKIKVNHSTSYNSIKKKIAENIIKISADRKLYNRLSIGAYKFAKKNKWKNVVQNNYRKIDELF